MVVVSNVEFSKEYFKYFEFYNSENMPIEFDCVI